MHLTTHDELIQDYTALMEGVTAAPALLANTAAWLMEVMPQLNWAGFYLVSGEDEKLLLLGHFVGRSACVDIAFGKGVCGTAAERGEAIIVPDVQEFPGHIACDARSQSEMVLPFMVQSAEDLTQKHLFGVLDLDAPVKNRFTEDDLALCTRVLEHLAECLGPQTRGVLRY